MWMCGPFLLLLWAFCSPCQGAIYDFLAYCDAETIDVTVRIVNDVTEPRFDVSLALKSVARTTALGMLEHAAELDQLFRFTVVLRKYGASYISTINGLRGPAPISDIPSWSMRIANVIYTGGFERYIPKNNETIVFIYENLRPLRYHLSMVVSSSPPRRPSRCDIPEYINMTLRLDSGLNQYDVTLLNAARTNLLGTFRSPFLMGDPHSLSLGMIKMSFVNKTVGYVINDVDYVAEIFLEGSSSYWSSADTPLTKDLVWELRDAAGNPIPEGVSYYIPQNNDFVQLVYVPTS